MGKGLRTILSSQWLYGIIRMLLAVLFVYGGAAKLMDPKAFARTISSYNLLPEVLLPFAATGLPVAEVAAGLALLWDIRGGLAAVSGLLSLFVVVLGFGIIQGLDADCGCFGADDIIRRDGLRQAFFRDLVLLAIVVPFLAVSRRLRSRGGKQ